MSEDFTPSPALSLLVDDDDGAFAAGFAAMAPTLLAGAQRDAEAMMSAK